MILPNQIPDELNKLLDDAAREYEQNGRKYLYDKIKALQEFLKRVDIPIEFLENALQENIDFFLEREPNATSQKIKDLLKELAEIEVKKKQVIAEGNYEEAARLRDIDKKIPNLILDLVVEHKGLKSGFNLFKGKFIIVSHNHTSKCKVIEMLNF